MNTLSHDSEIIARDWLCESQGDPTTAGLRHAVMLLLEHAEAENERLRAELENATGKTADGKRYGRSSKVWYRDPTGYSQSLDVGLSFRTDSSVPEPVYCPYPVYSTREAADAAGGDDE